MKKKHIILGITGSIAAYKACNLISEAKKAGLEVTCIATKEAEHFITLLTLESLSGNTAFGAMFAKPESRCPQHISLAEKADMIVIYPASANIIGKIANGICDDLLTCTVMASKAPVLIAPAMNNNMYLNKIVQGNISSLKKAGYKFIGPVKGKLACGNFAVGHIANEELALKEVKKCLK